MALTTVDHDVHAVLPTPTETESPPPPEVAITSCNPWPGPYYVQGGLRRVAPYHYTYNTFCKQRWRDRELLEVFATEFRDRTEEYYRNAIERGLIMLNGKPAESVHTQIQNGDVISHTLHRHEPPVTAQPIRVIHEDEDQVVINKPAGVPVHPAGRYKFNSVVEIMRAERHDAFNPLPCNRLDRLTSGVMFIGKTAKKAEAISQKLRERTVRKEYVARVKGRFPDGDDWDGDAMRGGVVKCDEPILQISPILGLNRARASGKPAKTLFRRVAYYGPQTKAEQIPSQSDVAHPEHGQAVASPVLPMSGSEDEGYSIVHCLPLTGRTHQIRVHLQFLGHPISNDPIYSNRRVFGPNLAKSNSSGEDDAAVIAALSKMGKTEVAEGYSYAHDAPAQDVKVLEKRMPHGDEVRSLVDQTQQITLSELQATQVESSKTDTNRSPSDDDRTKSPSYKPLPQSLHCLPPSTSSTPGLKAPSYDNARPLILDNVPLSHGPLSSLTSHDTDADLLASIHADAVADYNRRKGEKLTGHVCPVCQTPLYSDPGPHELGIYLHALSYADVHGEWRYQSPMPDWGLPPGGRPGPVDIGEWLYEGAGREGLELTCGDEKARERRHNEDGMLKNRGLKDGVCAARP